MGEALIIVSYYWAGPRDGEAHYGNGDDPDYQVVDVDWMNCKFLYMWRPAVAACATLIRFH